MVHYGLRGGICGGGLCGELTDARGNQAAIERVTGMSQNTITNRKEKVKMWKMWVLRVGQIILKVKNLPVGCPWFVM